MKNSLNIIGSLFILLSSSISYGAREEGGPSHGGPSPHGPSSAPMHRAPMHMPSAPPTMHVSPPPAPMHVPSPQISRQPTERFQQFHEQPPKRFEHLERQPQQTPEKLHVPQKREKVHKEPKPHKPSKTIPDATTSPIIGPTVPTHKEEVKRRKKSKRQEEQTSKRSIPPVQMPQQQPTFMEEQRVPRESYVRPFEHREFRERHHHRRFSVFFGLAPIFIVPTYYYYVQQYYPESYYYFEDFSYPELYTYFEDYQPGARYRAVLSHDMDELEALLQAVFEEINIFNIPEFYMKPEYSILHPRKSEDDLMESEH